MTITMTKISTGAAVAFPFALKDTFRNAFPSAKWNASLKRWEVGPRSISRLESWIAKINGSSILDDIAVNEEIEMTAREIERLQAEIAAMRDRLTKAGDLKVRAAAAKETAEKLKASLAQITEQVKVAEAEVKATEADAESAKSDVDALAAPIATRETIDTMKSQMIKCAGKPFYVAGAEFKAIKEKAEGIRASLKAVGIRCRALNRIAAADFNRTSRDKSDLLISVEFEQIVEE